ncbi:MAG: hypothetical protein PWQ96_1013 [Clostridia bacterium]|jgi:chromosome segregation ATPase|nr:hypothetical protein [Clostridiales bacterium]MDK2985371.1 hypothetical protein [Clostridia bacterium]
MSTSNVSIQKNGKPKKNKNFSAAIILALIIIWSGLVYGGYWFVQDTLSVHREKMQSYVDEAVKNVQETNAMNIRSLEDKLEALQYEMKKISKALDKADESIQDSNSSREKLNEKIESLDEQLEDLKKSLDILKESQQ